MLSWFPTLMKKDKIPKRISILNGWMEFHLGALGLCKCLCFVESWVFFMLGRLDGLSWHSSSFLKRYTFY